jgi:hypothetical protein
MVTLTTSIIFLLPLECTLEGGEFYKGRLRVLRQPIRWSDIAQSFRNNILEVQTEFLNIIQTSFDFNELEYKAVSLN